MKLSLIAALCACFLSGVVWTFLPTSLGSHHETFEPITVTDFSRLRDDAIALGVSVSPNGIEVIPGDSRSQSVQFNCQGVPVLTLINGSTVLSILTYAGADRRAPDIASFRRGLYPNLVRSGSQLKSNVEQPSGFSALVLEYRDGIDVSVDCSKKLGGNQLDE